MKALNSQEKRFFESLKDIFIGAKVEGVSGYSNLMNIKSSYFDKIFILLQKDIEAKNALNEVINMLRVEKEIEGIPDLKINDELKDYTLLVPVYKESRKLYE